MHVTSIFEEYASVEAQIAALTVKKEQLRPHILEAMKDQKVDRLETSVGKFSRGVRKVWTYTEKVEELNDALKAQKAKEESTGEAQLEEVDQLRFTKIKL